MPTARRSSASVKPVATIVATPVDSDDAKDLIAWYREDHRDLPWRENRDPYRIWVSEVMLQQTTVTAVIPFYEKFMRRFPTLTSLAEAPLEDVIERWAGLGYYSRARNLHKAAIALAGPGFPRTHAELEEFPGFGPYTARAVSSLAFDEKTGVLDGNVIRVLSRRYGLKVEWWKPQGRAQLQTIADQLAQVDAPADLNQGMMELGATVCTPQSPSCFECPWNTRCVARLTKRIAELPLRKPRRDRELWAWHALLIERDDDVLLVPNTYAPFLKGHWILPGSVQRLDLAPEDFHYKGTVTHHDIFVSVTRPKPAPKEITGAKWISRARLNREIPSSMIRKAIEGNLFT